MSQTVLKSTLHALLVVLSMVGLTGCSLFDNLKETHDATLELDKKTTDLAEKTQGIEDLTQTLLEQNRQGSANEIRQESLKRLKEATTLEEKVSQAGHYFYAFEFQLFDERIDSPTKRAAIYQEAMEEIFREISEFANGKRLDDLNPANNDAGSLNLYALATGMHVVNSIQTLEAQRNGYTAVSVLDLIQKGLNQLHEVSAGKRTEASMDPFAREVAINEELAVYILRTRFNFMTALPLADLTNINAGGVAGIIEKLRLVLTHWDASQGLAKLNTSQIRFCDEKLELGLATRDMLLDLGEDPKLDANLLKIYKNMVVTDGVSSEVSTEATGFVQRLAKDQQAVVLGTHL